MLASVVREWCSSTLGIVAEEFKVSSDGIVDVRGLRVCDEWRKHGAWRSLGVRPKIARARAARFSTFSKELVVEDLVVVVSRVACGPRAAAVEVVESLLKAGGSGSPWLTGRDWSARVIGGLVRAEDGRTSVCFGFEEVAVRCARREGDCEWTREAECRGAIASASLDDRPFPFRGDELAARCGAVRRGTRALRVVIDRAPLSSSHDPLFSAVYAVVDGARVSASARAGVASASAWVAWGGDDVRVQLLQRALVVSGPDVCLYEVVVPAEVVRRAAFDGRATHDRIVVSTRKRRRRDDEDDARLASVPLASFRFAVQQGDDDEQDDCSSSSSSRVDISAGSWVRPGPESVGAIARLLSRLDADLAKAHLDGTSKWARVRRAIACEHGLSTSELALFPAARRRLERAAGARLTVVAVRVRSTDFSSLPRRLAVSVGTVVSRPATLLESSCCCCCEEDDDYSANRDNKAPELEPRPAFAREVEPPGTVATRGDRAIPVLDTFQLPRGKDRIRFAVLDPDQLFLLPSELAVAEREVSSSEEGLSIVPLDASILSSATYALEIVVARRDSVALARRLAPRFFRGRRRHSHRSVVAPKDRDYKTLVDVPAIDLRLGTSLLRAERLSLEFSSSRGASLGVDRVTAGGAAVVYQGAKFDFSNLSADFGRFSGPLVPDARNCVEALARTAPYAAALATAARRCAQHFFWHKANRFADYDTLKPLADDSSHQGDLAEEEEEEEEEEGGSSSSITQLYFQGY